MKSILLFFLLLSTMVTRAQFLPNGNFENWISMQFNDPDHWQVTNTYSVTLPDTPVTKVAGQSGLALRMQKEFYTNPTVGNGYPFDSTGGEPYIQQPTGMDIYARHDIYTGDSARIYVYFKNNSSVILADTFSIGGTHLSNFALYHFDLTNTFPTAPDSVILLITSGDPFNTLPTGPGFIEIDQVTFTGATQQLVNSGFENWHVVTDEEPYHWSSSGQVAKTTDNHEGNLAARLESYNEGIVDGLPSIRYSSVLVTPAITTHNFIIEGYYKYITPGVDSGQLTMTMMGMASDPDIGEQVMDGTKLILPPVNSYTYFSLPIASQHILSFDQLQIEFTSSLIEPAVAVEGSALYLDGVRIVDPTSVGSANANTDRVSIYPNPVNDVLHIAISGKSASWTATVFDITGGRIKSHLGSKSMGLIPVNDLASGIYFCEIRIGNNITRHKFLKY